ncbi:MAG: glycosyltransferase, partial [Planctomycetota bacterium]
GLPVIATRWRSIPELVIPAVNGLLVEPRDIPQLAAAMQRLVREDSLFLELRDGALATGREHSAEAACERIERWISNLSGCPLAAMGVHAQQDSVPAALPRRTSSTEVEA